MTQPTEQQKRLYDELKAIAEQYPAPVFRMSPMQGKTRTMAALGMRLGPLQILKARSGTGMSIFQMEMSQAQVERRVRIALNLPNDAENKP